MKCAQTIPLLSAYLDGAVAGTQMRSIHEHLENCPQCDQEFSALMQTQQLLTKVGRRKAPADLSLKLRLAISREAARSPQSYVDILSLRLQHLLEAFMFPAMVGLAAAVVLFVIFMGFSSLPLQASNSDVPLMLYTAPQIQESAFGMSFGTIKDDSLVIEAYVDSHGRIEDYRVLSNPDEGSDVPSEVKNMLIFTTFRPAMSMGVPTSGKAVMSFSKVSVKG
jgi:putative zinc finger protein